ncbi:MAG: AAA family ATPase [Candidatus Sumerlaeota bacterium]|nr:AAA family ATPase [Candidatus Sumerlaeota bacterium]
MPIPLIPSLEAKGFGPIVTADVKFGDLTVLVGPQASGKSIFVQLLKLLIDTAHVRFECRRAGIDWEEDFKQFLDVYFGEGMRSLWNPSKTWVKFRGKETSLPGLVKSTKPRKGESMFFIPAQRVLAMRDGWPLAFEYYNAGVPFAVREFSERLRQMMMGFGTKATLFPAPRRLKEEFRVLIQDHIFPGFKLKVVTEQAQKRMVLSTGEKTPVLPFMVWSAGQREFVPLMLGLYWLMTSGGSSRRKGVKWVVIEELEMGLHPRAISIVVLMLFELAARGYRVCVSTHSPQVLDAIWALKHLKTNMANPKALLDIFEVPANLPMTNLAKKIMKKSVRVYYFDRKSGSTKDISNLDAASEEAGESGWGGLSEFSGRANEAVARAVANSERESNLDF